jgi:hypothetical protein
MEAFMSSITRISTALCIAFVAVSPGCEQAPPAPAEPTASATASAPATTAAPVKTTAPTASVAAPKPSHPCPEGSTGDGTFKSPCVAKGAKRLMDVQWTGKIDDKGPWFRVTNNAKLEILYGNVVVYFYDKAGKQLEVPAASSADKAQPKQSCSGNIFAGPMKAAEKAVLAFSCVHKKHVPAGTVAIEAEMQMVGFTSATSTKADTYWRNEELAPDARSKGGIK